MTTTSTNAEKSTTQPIEGQDWQLAGDGWGSAATDWACLFEHYSSEVVTAIFDHANVGAGVDLLDVACGSGLVVRHAAAMGATVSGIDAATELIEIAQTRTENADVRVGSMYELPWIDESFDAVTAINGIWGGCRPALDEAFRVLRPRGSIGMSFWGDGKPNDLREVFLSIARRSPAEHVGSMVNLNAIAAPGVAEQMLADAGFERIERGRRVSVIEWPDRDTAWRAISSVGPAVPALRGEHAEELRHEVLEAIEHCRDEFGIYRFCNDHHFALARKP